MLCCAKIVFGEEIVDSLENKAKNAQKAIDKMLTV